MNVYAWGIFGLFIGSLLGALTHYFFTKPHIIKVEAESVTSTEKAALAEKERQKIDLELAAVRVKAERVDEVSNLLSEKDGQITSLQIKNSSLLTSIEEREKALSEERTQLVNLKESFKTQFAELSAIALNDNSEKFLQNAERVLKLQNQKADSDLEKRQEAIQQLVKPIQDGIKAVGETAKEMENKREKAFGTIEEQIKQVIEQSTEVARQTSGLKDALKKPNVRGRWGEVQLKNCIELAGMEEHCDVTFQDSSISPDDFRVRPDMTVRMPGGRKIVVDAKTPMEAFLQHIEATTDEERNGALILHGRAVKNHISGLASRDYMQNVAGSPDFVIMFLPNESFLAMALEKEPVLMEEALNKKVVITTPGTLIGLLKVLRYGFNEEKIAQNAQLIADEGGKLNTQITFFLEEFAKLGKALKTASDCYENSSRRVEKQITFSSEKLTQLGAKSRKSLSSAAARMLMPGEDEDIVNESLVVLET